MTPESRPAAGITLHLSPEPRWRAHADTGATHYTPEPFAEEGFIHTTHGEETVLEIANLFYREDPRPYLLLEVDLGAVAAPAVYEDPDDRFPHVYGPLEIAAVRSVRRVVRGEDGAFLEVGDPA